LALGTAKKGPVKDLHAQARVQSAQARLGQ
jgi:hypothetical protein